MTLQSDVDAAVINESLTIVPNAREVHASIFEAYPESEAKRVSREEREAKELANRSLAYGEIPYDTIEAIFQLMRSQFGVLIDKGGNFYDIGSGCGKVVLAAALLHDFRKCYGIELLDGLHAMSLNVLDRWRYSVLEQLPPSKSDMDVGFVKGDASKLELWTDATMVFCNATCFSDSLIQALSKQSELMVDGAYFVTVTKPLISKRWKVMLEEKFPMSWGNATVIVQRKVF